jgi:hypothetical protein
LAKKSRTQHLVTEHNERPILANGHRQIGTEVQDYAAMEKAQVPGT